MREFSFRWDEGFKKGIRPHYNLGVNSPYLYDAYNVKIGSFGPEAPTDMDDTSSGSPDSTVIWPMPQVFSTSQGPMLVSSSNLNLINSDLTLTLVLPGLAGGRYDIADFDYYQVWTNGATVIIRDDLGAWSVYPAALTPWSVCNFRGQLVAGGFGTGVYKNWVAWGGIGEVNLDLLFSNSLSLSSTDYSANKNTAGNRIMPSIGQVHHVKTLGNSVVIYSEDGVYALIAVEEPAPTFGFKKLHNVGIRNRGAVGGDEDVHVFVDELSYVWTIDKELKMKRLGYEFIFEDYSADVVISFDPLFRDFYIANGVTSCLLADGLSRVYWVPTSMIRCYDKLVAPYNTSGDGYPFITTMEFDCNTRAIKTLSNIELDVPGNGTVAVDYRYATTDAFRIGVAKTMTKNGTVAPMISAVEFRVRIVGTAYPVYVTPSLGSTGSMLSMLVRFKLTDKRLQGSRYSPEYVRSKA